MANNQSGFNALLKELPHIIVVALLVIAVLFVATKYKWVHCSQIPQWCDIYCMATGHSQVAIIYGDDGAGLGDPTLLRARITRERLFTNVVPIKANELSAGLLNDYELVILTRYKHISLKQAITLRDYLNRGGSILWEGDSASEYVVTAEDERYARAENLTKPGFYESYKFVALNQSRGFGLLGDLLGAKFNSTSNATQLRFKALSESHLMVQGIKNFNFTAPYAFVDEDPRLLTKVAVIKWGENGEAPMLLERKYVGRMVYAAVPLELIDSKTLLTNALDYLVTC